MKKPSGVRARRLSSSLRWANSKMGELTPLETYSVGQRPMWVLTTRLGD
jgi:hypothetical protein